MVAQVQKQTGILREERGRVESRDGEIDRGGIIHIGRPVGANTLNHQEWTRDAPDS